MLRIRSLQSQTQKLVICWVLAGIGTREEDSGGSPMVEIGVVEVRTRGGEEGIDIFDSD